MEPETITTITLAAWLVAFLGGTAVPVLTGIATKLRATSGRKALVGVALSAAVAVVASVVDAGGTFDPKKMAVLFALTFMSHVTSFYGFWKPVGGGAAPGATATADVGIS